MSYSIIVNGINAEVTKRSVKNITLRIMYPDANVKITAPHSVSQEYLIEFIKKNSEKINKSIEKNANLPSRTKKYVAGEKHLLFGKEYTLNIIDTDQCRGVSYNDDKNIYLTTKFDNPIEIKNALKLFYRSRLLEIIPAIATRYEEAMGLKASEYKVRDMKTRWGSINILHKRIWISLNLAKYPVECLEYVIVHELSHLIERRHNKNFYQIVEKYYADYKKSENYLKKLL